MYVSIYVCIMYVRKYICMYVRTYAYMYVRMYAGMHVSMLKGQLAYKGCRNAALKYFTCIYVLYVLMYIHAYKLN